MDKGRAEEIDQNYCALGAQVFASAPADQASVDLAKAFIGANNLTAEDVKLGTIGNTVIIEAKREILLLS